MNEKHEIPLCAGMVAGVFATLRPDYSFGTLVEDGEPVAILFRYHQGAFQFSTVEDNFTRPPTLEDKK